MLSLNVPNAITVALISIGAWVLFQMLWTKFNGASA